MSELYFTKTHEWICFCAGKAVIGITGKGLIGDIVYAELPKLGQKLIKDEPCASLESAKTTLEVTAPLSGTVSAVNDMIYDEPEIISREPMKNWLFILEYAEEDEGLLTQSEYEQL